MKKLLIILPSVALILVLGYFAALYFFHSSLTEVNADFIREYESDLPAVSVTVDVVEQRITCGYAVIEMLAKWNDQPEITEAFLYADNGDTITTAMGDGFQNTANRYLQGYTVKRLPNVRGVEMITGMHYQLKQGLPVPIEFAAQNAQGEWTLHFGLVTTMDIAGDSITVANPYGYEEVYTVEAFLRALRYDSYENMPLPLRLGFFFGVFSRNTWYALTPI